MSEIKIEDYLKYYIGQTCWEEWSGKADGVIHGVSLTHVYVMHKTMWTFKCDEVKVILRPLSSMTEDEINKICSILIGREIICTSINWSEEKDWLCAYWKKEKDITGQYDFIEMGIHISNIGSPFKIDYVWNYINDKGVGMAHEPLHNSHEITRYLLNQGFDLFGLIPAGLALSTSIDNQENISI